MKNETILRACIALSIIILLWVTVMWNNDNILINTQKDTIDRLTFEKDSLYDENFIKSVELERHELTRNEMFLKHKGLEKKYNNFINHETE